MKNKHSVIKEMEEFPLKVAVASVLLVLASLAGCNGLYESDTPKPTSTSSPVPSTSTPTPESTMSTITTTTTTTETPRQSFSYKQKFFTANYTTSIQENGVNVGNTTNYGHNETLHLTYEMRDPENDNYVGLERENITLMYVAMAEVYLDRGFDESWIPKQVNVTAITPEGELYETAYTTFERAKKMIEGEITAKRYLLEYYGTIEMGPANPEYEG